jgi:predicted RNA binding protein YcfA (HicA-like mRNA interferase family)
MASSYTLDVKRVLTENGCHFHRQGKGDHAIWFSPITKRYFTVDAKILSRHTANAIMKQAGIDHKF